MATVRVVFSVTAPQLNVLRHIARTGDSGEKLVAAARRDPRWSLVSKGLLEHVPGNYSERFIVTAFGAALVEGLAKVRL